MISVVMNAGRTALKRTREGADSSAALRISASMPGLAHGIGAEVGMREAARDRRHADEGAAARRDQPRDAVLHAQEGAEHVQVEDAQELLGVLEVERRELQPPPPAFATTPSSAPVGARRERRRSRAGRRPRR